MTCHIETDTMLTFGNILCYDVPIFSPQKKTCHHCQTDANLPLQPQRKLQPIPPPDQPWKHIGIDLVCDLQENSHGYKHLLVTTCYLSKFCAVRPLRTKKSSEVLSQLESIYFTLGVPQVIQHDQGPEFVSKVFPFLLAIF